MRIALDSSVLIAAHISRAGVCSELVEDVLLRHELVVSEFILGEVARKLVEKFHYSASDAAENVAALRRACILAEPSEVPADLCRDPDDLPVLGTAVGGGWGSWSASIAICSTWELLRGFRSFALASIGRALARRSREGSRGLPSYTGSRCAPFQNGSRFALFVSRCRFALFQDVASLHGLQPAQPGLEA